jgi:transcriptional antiterminator RfaH
MSSAPDDVRWYCLKTQPKHEELVAARLRKMPDVEIYGPRLRLQRSTTRGVRWFVEAMFPGYVFARFPFALRHKEIRATNGVSGIVHFGAHYAVIPDSVVEELRRHTGSGQLAEVRADLTEGSTVKIAEGPFSGLSALVTQVLPGRERIRILLEFLGQEVPAEVKKSAVLPEQQHPLRA